MSSPVVYSQNGIKFNLRKSKCKIEVKETEKLVPKEELKKNSFLYIQKTQNSNIKPNMPQRFLSVKNKKQTERKMNKSIKINKTFEKRKHQILKKKSESECVTEDTTTLSLDQLFNYSAKKLISIKNFEVI